MLYTGQKSTSSNKIYKSLFSFKKRKKLFLVRKAPKSSCKLTLALGNMRAPPVTWESDRRG